MTKVHNIFFQKESSQVLVRQQVGPRQRDPRGRVRDRAELRRGQRDELHRGLRQVRNKRRPVLPDFGRVPVKKVPEKGSRKSRRRNYHRDFGVHRNEQISARASARLGQTEALRAFQMLPDSVKIASNLGKKF